MGLTIHYSLNLAKATPTQAYAVVEQIRQRSLDLPFKEVGKIKIFNGDECDWDKCDKEDPNRWLLIQSSQSVNDPEIEGTSYTVLPSTIIAFDVEVGEGCEPANFGLCLYPKTIKVEDSPRWVKERGGRRGWYSGSTEKRTIRTKLKGWSWGSFCKTQYASRHGIKNFLRCHVSVITLLEWIQSNIPELKVHIDDEGKYGTSNYTDDWKVPNPVYTDHPAKHDLEALAKEVGEWNEMIAGHFGRMKDALQKSGNEMDIISVIQKFPDFEHLEAKGREDETVNNFVEKLNVAN